MKTKGILKTFICIFVMMLFACGVNVKAEEEVSPLSVALANGVEEVELIYKEKDYVAPKAEDIVVSNCVGNCTVSISHEINIGEIKNDTMGNFPVTYTVVDDNGTSDVSDDRTATIVRNFYVINTNPTLVSESGEANKGAWNSV